MDKNVIRQAQKADFEAISTLIALQNQNPETHCIHSETGEDAQSICNEMLRLDADGEICFVTSSAEGQVTGAMGCELDVELGRGWLRGPFVVDERNDWNAAAASLYEGLLELLSASIRQLDTFLDVENRHGNAFYLSRDFEQLRLVHVYLCDRPEGVVQEADLCERLHPRQAQAFIDLHDTTFPGTYATGQRILNKLDDQHQVFVYGQGSEMLGYLYSAIDEYTGDGSIEFVGVREEARGKGIGRLLLQKALHWLFEVKQVQQVMLVVNDNLANARSLYESVGFRLKYTGVHNRKTWE
ncbi:MAG: hypothetical protein C0410_00705 [Anaerolinea sp.]|nr:hypothetical protein [Anaerolinea sp.]